MNDSVYLTPPRTSISPSNRSIPSAKLLTNVEFEEVFSLMKNSSHSTRQRRQQCKESKMMKKICEPSWMQRERRYPQLEFDHSLLNPSTKSSEEKHSFCISENVLREKFQELIRKTA